MRKVLFMIAVMMFSMATSAQIFYNGEKLSSSRVQGKKVNNIAGAYLTLGMSSAKSNLVIEGETSGFDIEESKPSFDILFSEEAKDSTFADKSNMDNIVLVIIHAKKNTRLLRTGKYGLAAGVQTGLLEDDIILLSIEESETDKYSYTVIPKKKLSKGEYAFVYVNNGKATRKIYDFTVK